MTQDDHADDRANEEHPRPVRSPREVRLPLAVRKELLTTRAALERYDAAQALRSVRGSARRMANIGTWLPRLTHQSGWLKMMGVTRNYPMLSTAITLAMPLLRRTAIGRVAWKASKLGMAAGAGYWAYKTWKRMQPLPPHPTPPEVAAARVAVDTGFRDPLVPSPVPAPAPIISTPPQAPPPQIS